MLKTLPHLAWQTLILTDQKPCPERIDVGGVGAQNRYQALYIHPINLHAGEIRFLNFEQLNPTNKKLLGVNKVDYRPHNWL